MPMLASEKAKMFSNEFREIVAEWPSERIAGLEEKVKLPRSRVVALLGIGMSAFGSLCKGAFTPGPALCRRMAQLEDMAERGELHATYIPDKTDMQRRMCLFRAWFFEQPPRKDFPLVTVAIKVRWSKSRYHEVTIPVEHLPALRLTRWEGLLQVVKAVTMAVRGLARGNARLLWKEIDNEYWTRYARETLPGIVEERAKAAENLRRKR